MSLRMDSYWELSKHLEVKDKIKVLNQRVHYCSNRSGNIKEVPVPSSQIYEIVRKSRLECKNVIIEYVPAQLPEDFGLKGYEWVKAVIYPDSFKHVVVLNE